MGVGGQNHTPAALPPGIPRYPLYRRLGGPQGRSENVWKFPPPQGFDPQTVHPLASRYTDWAIVAHVSFQYELFSIYRAEAGSVYTHLYLTATCFGYTYVAFIGLGVERWKRKLQIQYNKFHCFTVHFDSLSFIHTNSCTFSYNYVSVF